MMHLKMSRTVAILLTAGVVLGGCATRESAENAQNAANVADKHAATAQARADEAYGIGNNATGVGNSALSVGNNALTSAQLANQKADQNAVDIAAAKRRIAYLERKISPHHKRHRRHTLHKSNAQLKPTQG
jgi:hypothetical protein